MVRLLSFVAFATLLLLVVCSAGSHKAVPHVAHLDQLELPPAVSSTTALEFTPDFNVGIASMAPELRRGNSERFHAASPESISLRDPLTASSILRV